MIFRVLLLLLLFGSTSFASELELSAAGYYRKYTDVDQKEEVGFGIRGRYNRFKANGWGWYVRFHFEENLVNPLLVPSYARRWGKELFFELGVGAYIGTFVDRNVTLASIPTIGYRFSSNFYLSLPFYWDLNIGSPFLMEFAPFIGYRF